MLAAFVCAAALAGCGSSGTPSPKATPSSNPQFELSQCMRTHGAPNFPDPQGGPGGEGFTISQSPGSSTVTVEGIAFSGPAFESAVKTCKLFGGGSAPSPISESQKLQLIAFAHCMRTHGVPSYPDPTFPSGGGISSSLPAGVSRNSPAVRQAAAACNRG